MSRTQDGWQGSQRVGTISRTRSRTWLFPGRSPPTVEPPRLPCVARRGISGRREPGGWRPRTVSPRARMGALGELPLQRREGARESCRSGAEGQASPSGSGAHVHAGRSLPESGRAERVGSGTVRGAPRSKKMTRTPPSWPPSSVWTSCAGGRSPFPRWPRGGLPRGREPLRCHLRHRQRSLDRGRHHWHPAPGAWRTSGSVLMAIQASRAPLDDCHPAVRRFRFSR
jgi:hypothetical protein